MRALVTGATGVVGANLVRALLAAGWSVRALVRPGPVRRALLNLPIESCPGDVLDHRSVAEAMEGVDVVFHAAARFAYRSVPAAELDRVAVDGTRTVVEAAATAKVRRVVLTSSSAIFGSSATPERRTEKSPLTPGDASSYAMSKVRQTRAAFSIARARGIDLIAACPTLTVGPWDYRLSESNAAIVRYLNDPFRSTFAGGCNLACAEDVARGHILLAEHGEPGESYLLGGTDVHWSELHAEVSALCRTHGPLLTATHTGAYLTAVWGELFERATGTPPSLTRDEVRMIGRWYWYDDAKARSLGYRSRSLGETLALAIEWLIRTEFIRPDVRSAVHLAGGPDAARPTERPVGVS